MSSAEIARRSTRGSLIIFGGNFVSTVILAVSSIIIARLLGPADYGSYTLVALVPTLMQLFVGLGVSSAITRYAAYHLARKEVDVAKRFAVNAMLFLILFGAALALFVVGAAGFLANDILHRPELTTFVRYISLAVLAQTVFQSSLYGLVGWYSMGTASYSTIFQSVVRLAVAPILVFAGYGVAGALTGYAAGYVVGATIASLAFYAYKLRGVAAGVNDSFQAFYADVREMVSYGFPIYLGGVLQGLSVNYVTLLVAAIASNTVVGNYQAANNVTAAITISTGAIAVGLFPAFASLHGLGEDTALAFKHATKYVVYMMAPVVIFLVADSSLIIRILYGEKFSIAGAYLALLSLAALPPIVGMLVANTFFAAIGRTRLTMAVNAVSAFSVFALAPLFGIALGGGVEGLIFATIVSVTLAAAAGLYFATRYLHAGVDLRGLAAIIASSLLGWVAVLAFSPIHLERLVALVLDLAVYLVVYLTAAPLLRAFDRNDVLRLEAAISGMGVFGRLLRPILNYELMVLRWAGREAKAPAPTSG